jgi:hypothetical protein
MSLRDQILGADDLPVEEVEVPEWGVTVRVRTMMGYERDAFEASVVQGEKRNLDNLRARLCAMCIVDEDGNRVFSESDAEALGRKNAGALDRVFAVAQRLNGMSKQDVDDLVGNSEPGQSDSSASI